VPSDALAREDSECQPYETKHTKDAALYLQSPRMEPRVRLPCVPFEFLQIGPGD
jgi:hypothetical protein